MKNFTLTTLFFFTLSGVMSQEKLLLRTNIITGQGVQAGKLRNAIGIGAQYQADIKRSPFEYIVTAETHLNGMRTLPYHLTFNNSVTHIDARYFSTITKVTGGGSYVPFKSNIITPFMSVQAGVLWYHTTVRIDDPHDADGCRPIDSKTVKLSVIAIGQVETGLRLYLKKTGKERSFIQAGAGFTAGSRGSYIKLMNDHQTDNSTPSYNTKFETNSGEVHEHSLGKIYRTNTNQIFYSIGFGIAL